MGRGINPLLTNHYYVYNPRTQTIYDRRRKRINEKIFVYGTEFYKLYRSGSGNVMIPKDLCFRTREDYYNSKKIVDYYKKFITPTSELFHIIEADFKTRTFYINITRMGYFFKSPRTQKISFVANNIKVFSEDELCNLFETRDDAIISLLELLKPGDKIVYKSEIIEVNEELLKQYHNMKQIKTFCESMEKRYNDE